MWDIKLSGKSGTASRTGNNYPGIVQQRGSEEKRARAWGASLVLFEDADKNGQRAVHGRLGGWACDWSDVATPVRTAPATERVRMYVRAVMRLVW